MADKMKNCPRCGRWLNANNTTGLCYKCYNKTVTKGSMRRQLAQANAETNVLKQAATALVVECAKYAGSQPLTDTNIVRCAHQLSLIIDNTAKEKP